MTEAEVIRTMREHLEGQFPKGCPACHRRFAALREYLLTTEHVGPAISYDVELGDWTPLRQLGILTYANCPCGTTLALILIRFQDEPNSGRVSAWQDHAGLIHSLLSGRN